MWKDSAIDVVAMAKSKDESTEKVHSSLLTNQRDTAKVFSEVSNDSNPDLAALARPSSTTQSLTAEGSVRSVPASDPAPSGMPKQEKDSKEQTDWWYSEVNADGYFDMKYPYSAPTVLGAKQSCDNFFCCLLAPWFAKKEQDRLQEPNEEEATISVNGEEKVAEQTLHEKRTREDDDTATATVRKIYGEQLTDHDRLAVMARLRASETDPGHFNSPFYASPTQQSGLEFEPASVEKIPAKDDGTAKSGTPKVKGILKTTSSMIPAPAVVSLRSTGRRSLFTTAYEKKAHPGKHARFSSMAHVVIVKSCTDMSVVEKTSIWWQKSDYDSFKEAERLIAKAIIEDGNEIRLTNTSPSSVANSDGV
jgi:hypothetical protein